tara:strand:- start:687 stop:1157 length:471 start_codon:yes stop_codon:yes gene_type:complete
MFIKKYITIIFILFLSNCSLNKVVHHHGVHNLEKKHQKLKINYSNKNDIHKLIGPPSTKSTFDNDVYVYIERKTSSSKLTKFGKKTLVVNNVLVLEIDSNGILKSKEFYNKDDMKDLKFAQEITKANITKKSFIYGLLHSLRQKIDDPLGKKRTGN